MMVTGFRLGFAKALLIVLLLHLFLTHIRFTFFLFPVLAILVAPELARQFPKLSADDWRAQPRDALEHKVITSFRPVFAAFAAVLLAVAGLQAFVLRTAPLEVEHLNARHRICEIPRHHRQCLQSLQFRRHADLPRHQDLPGRPARPAVPWRLHQEIHFRPSH